MIELDGQNLKLKNRSFTVKQADGVRESVNRIGFCSSAAFHRYKTEQLLNFVPSYN